MLKTKSICKVSFRINAKDAIGAKTLQILGDFNNCDKAVEPMKALKSGDFTQTIEFETGNEYQFRYFIDGSTRTNDLEADLKVDNEFGEKNGIVSTIQ
ncbi:MAG: isoamylase early set domain-containing protein [Prolixibacteraceae bacterium]|nr:isoamylase early set domain-containing protein [Prolixibacteraceae bacterium]